MHTDTATHPRLGRDRRVGASRAACRSSPREQMLTGSTAATARRSAGLTWSGNTLSFTIAVGAGANNLQAMVPTHVGGRRAHRHHAERHSRRLHDADDQGHRVRVLRRRRPAPTSRSTRSTRRRPSSPPWPRRRHERHRDASPGRPTRPSTSRVDYGTSAGSLTLERRATAPWSTSHTIHADGPHAEHDLLLPRHLGGRREQHGDVAEPAGGPGDLHDALRERSSTRRSPTSRPGRPATEHAMSQIADGEVILAPTVERRVRRHDAARRLVARRLERRRHRHGRRRQL